MLFRDERQQFLPQHLTRDLQQFGAIRAVGHHRAALPSGFVMVRISSSISAAMRPVNARFRDGSSPDRRSEEHTSELQSLMRISYAVFCLKKKITKTNERLIIRRTDDNHNIKI